MCQCGDNTVFSPDPSDYCPSVDIDLYVLGSSMVNCSDENVDVTLLTLGCLGMEMIHLGLVPPCWTVCEGLVC